MSEVTTYLHKVQYYETDGMRIVHHSNYIRWFEEARMEALRRAGLDYDKMEEFGIMIPVLSVSCEYKQAVVFGETVRIETQVQSFNGLKFEVGYRIIEEENGVLHATGTSTHCFLDWNLKPVNVRKKAPHIYEYFSKYKK